MEPVSLVVQKFGGTSVADADRIRAVAEHVVRTRRAGHDLVVVVSAMGKTTDDLLRLAGDVSPAPHSPPASWTCWSPPVSASPCRCCAWPSPTSACRPRRSPAARPASSPTPTHGKAKILEVRADRLREGLAAGHVVVVAGFQGVSTDKQVTTLGRGGSDTTAVALAAALGADRLRDLHRRHGRLHRRPPGRPRRPPAATVSYEEMLEISAAGGRVLALRSVEFARNYHVALHVRSSFTWEPGTWVHDEEDSVEKAIISGVVHDTSEAKVTVVGVPDRPGIAARLFRALADEAVNVDMIVQNVSLGRRHRHLLHPAEGRPAQGRGGHRGGGRRRSAPPRSSPTPTSPASAWWARA